MPHVYVTVAVDHKYLARRVFSGINSKYSSHRLKDSNKIIIAGDVRGGLICDTNTSTNNADKERVVLISH